MTLKVVFSVQFSSTVMTNVLFSSDAFDGCGGCEYIFRVKAAEHSGHANEVVVTAEVDATGPISSGVVDEFILKAYQKPS